MHGPEHAHYDTSDPPVRIEPLSAERVTETAEVLSKVFRAEPISARLFDLEDPAVQARHARAMAQQLGAAVQDRDPTFIGLAGDRVVGVASASRLGLRTILHSIRAWAGLLPRLRRGAVRAGFAARPVRGIPRPYIVLNALGVMPGFEGQGIGRALLERVIASCSAEDTCAGIYIQTAGERSRRLYENAGFELLGERSADDITVAHLFWRTER